MEHHGDGEHLDSPDNRPGEPQQDHRSLGPRTRLGMLLGAGVVILLVLAVIGARVGRATSPPTTRPTTEALHAPTGLYASGTSDGSVVISWQPPHPAPIGYRIYRSSDRNGPYTIIGTVDAPDIDTFTDNVDLVPGTTYAYTVRAFNRRGETAPVGPVIVVLLPSASASPTVGAPTPLPTFVPLTTPTLTAVARLPRGGATSVPVASSSPGVGGFPSILPTPTFSLATPASGSAATVRPPAATATAGPTRHS